MQLHWCTPHSYYTGPISSRGPLPIQVHRTKMRLTKLLVTYGACVHKARVVFCDNFFVEVQEACPRLSGFPVDLHAAPATTTPNIFDWISHETSDFIQQRGTQLLAACHTYEKVDENDSFVVLATIFHSPSEALRTTASERNETLHISSNLLNIILS